MLLSYILFKDFDPQNTLERQQVEMFKFYAEEMLASSCNRSLRGVGDKPFACNPGVAGSILGFTRLSDDTLIRGSVSI